MQSVPITTKLKSSNPAYRRGVLASPQHLRVRIPLIGEVYSIQQYVIKFVSDLRQVGGFLWVSSTNKTARHDITELLLKVALNTITITLQPELMDIILAFQRYPTIIEILRI